MSGKRILAVLMVALLISGCSINNYDKQGEVTNDIAVTGDIGAAAGDKIDTDATSNGKNKTNKNSSELSQPSENQTVATSKDTEGTNSNEKKTAKLDYDMLNSLNNTKYSWGLGLNKEHKTPEVPSSFINLLERYDGIFVGDTNQKKVYLTFDEGYENGYTSMILDTLKANNVKATFFVTGPYIEAQTELVKRMLDEGHEVGNHTINHPSLPDVSNEELENEIYGLEKAFREKYGRGFKYIRPPMGEFSERTLAAAQQLGYKTMFWSFAYADWDTNNQKGAKYAHDMVMQYIHNGAVILLHAVSKDNAEALDSIIKDIRAEGYEISPMDL